MESKVKGLTAYRLKLIAIIAMFCDHFAYAFIPYNHPLNIMLRIFGKFTFPIMCFFIVEGYYHTHNLKRYAMRLAVFALISHIPYVFYNHWNSPNYKYIWGTLTLTPTSVIFTLLCGLLALTAWDKIKQLALRITVVAFFCLLPYWMHADWNFGVLVVLAFGVFRGNPARQLIAFLAASIPLFAPFVFRGVTGEFSWVALIQYIGFYLAFFLLQSYNGQRGGSEGSKWLFYIFYPVQFIVLYAIVSPIIQPTIYALFWAK